MPVNRRDLLASLLPLPSLAVISDLSFASQVESSSSFLDVSRVITGPKNLTLETARAHFDLIESDRRSNPLFSLRFYPKTASHFSENALIGLKYYCVNNMLILTAI